MDMRIFQVKSNKALPHTGSILIPYGAQMLIAAELTKLSPISIIGYLYYPIILGIVALLSILLRYPKRYS